MGEVYRARDTRLDRTVAIKILPAHLSANAEARQRFEREARAISSLSHPNICHLYDVGAEDGVDYLVMEFLEGETLSTRLARGPLAQEQLLRCGIEIAEGLEQAHRSGVVHRDLKPGNIMLTKSGAKLMDFGLAKAGAAPAASEPVSELTQALSSPRPAVTHPLTAQGTVVGTFQYMSPEQVEGKEADARSDIFALGALLFEMATGKRAFEGKSATSTMAAVLEREPPAVSSLAPTAPAGLDRIVKTCLEKEPDRRFQSAHDVGLQLQWLAQGPQEAVTAAAPAMAAGKKQRPFVAWGLAGAGLLLAIIFASLYVSGRKSARVLRAQLLAPENLRFNFAGDSSGPIVISPDGTHVVFSAAEGGKTQLYVRSLSGLAVQALPGTDGATFPFWSPDSRSVAFFSDGKLRRADIGGGPPVTICDAPVGRGGTWSAKGVILFSPNFSVPLYQVPASGGTPVAVTKLEGDYTTHRWPWFLPDGEHFLYLAANHSAPMGPSTAVFFGSMDGKENRLLVHTQSSAIYASGYLLFARENAIMAQRLEADSGHLEGNPAVVSADVRVDPAVWRTTVTASNNGILIYQPGGAPSGMSLSWVDRGGKVLSVTPERDAYQQIQLSPDNKQLAMAIGEQSPAIWVQDLTRGTRTRLTFGDEEDADFAWSPDGSRIAYTIRSAVVNTPAAIASKAASGAGEPKELLKLSSKGGMLQGLQDWSHDGRSMLFTQGTPGVGSGVDLWVLPLSGDGKPYAYDTQPGNQYQAEFSPDGRWVAYASDEAGRAEVYVAPFPWTGAKWQVSTTGGVLPRWRRDGTELYYCRQGSSQVFVAKVDGRGPSFQVGEVRPLFSLYNLSPSIAPSLYAVTSDGQKFVFITVGDTASASVPLAIVENWPAELKGK